MKKFYLYMIFVFVAASAKAQQIGMYSHYFFKPMVYNPAFTGTDDATNAMLVNRSQWTGFKGAPQLNLFTLDGNLLSKKVGLGLNLISDRKGLSNRVGGSLSYSYRISFNDETYLLLGVSAGIIDQSLNYAQAEVESANDPTLFTDMQRKTAFDASAGVAFVWKGLEVGAAVPQLAGNKIRYVDDTDVRSYYTQARHYMGTLKYKFFISKEKEISIAPMALVRYVPGAPFQYDGNINLEWKDKFWIGATYKNDYAVGGNAGVCIHKQLYIGYSYDFMIGTIGKYAGMSSEVMVDFKFGRNKKHTVEETQPAPQMTDNTGYKRQLDSLGDELHNAQEQLRQNQQRIRELNDRLSQQSQSRIQQGNAPVDATGAGTTANPSTSNPANNANQSASVIAANTNKTMENGTWLVSDQRSNYRDVNGAIPPKGFYVIAGTFVYQDFADAEVKRFNDIGFRETSRIYSNARNYNYIFIARNVTKEEALKKAADARSAGIRDAWVLGLE